MAKFVAKRRLDLTPEQALEIFERAFGNHYEVYKTALIGADFIIKKSGFTGVSVKIKHKSDRTIIVYNALAPSAMVRILFMGVLPMLILYFTSWKAMVKEVGAFVNQDPVFRGEALPASTTADAA